MGIKEDLKKVEDHEKTLRMLIPCMEKLIAENTNLRACHAELKVKIDALCVENDEMMKKQIEMETCLKK